MHKKGNHVEVTTKKRRFASKPSKNIAVHTLTTNVRRSARSIQKITTDSFYRPDLQKVRVTVLVSRSSQPLTCILCRLPLLASLPSRARLARARRRSLPVATASKPAPCCNKRCHFVRRVSAAFSRLYGCGGYVGYVTDAVFISPAIAAAWPLGYNVLLDLWVNAFELCTSTTNILHYVECARTS